MVADQKRWFKFWCSALTDDALQALSPDLRWAWVALGAHTKLHGTRGRIMISPQNAALAGALGVPLQALQATISLLPHVHIEGSKTANGMFAVTWDNWQYYQEDRSVAERVARLRSKRRLEEKRIREAIPKPLSSPGAGAQSNDSVIDQAGEVLAFFAKATGARYPLRVQGKPSASAQLVMARLRDGATVTDLRNVIVSKHDEWAGDAKMAQFIRPSTLFRKSNYEEYRAKLGGPA